MFDDIVDALVARLAPILLNIGDWICAKTPGLVGQWPTYEFMCRNTSRLAQLTVEHIILTVIAMVIAIILGVLIGVRVSSSPWPQTGTLLFWPVIGLSAAFLIVGLVALVTVPGDVAAIEGFAAPNVGSWSRVLTPDANLGLFGVLILIQSVLALVLGAVILAVGVYRCARFF